MFIYSFTFKKLLRLLFFFWGGGIGSDLKTVCHLVLCLPVFLAVCNCMFIYSFTFKKLLRLLFSFGDRQ